MPESQSQIAFEQTGLGSVLKQNRLVVPPNQREYAWTDREVRQLFQDFAKAIADSDPGYFLGTIVTIPRVNDTLEVVDGQQRLATTAILLAAIRDFLVGKEDILVESIDNEFLTGIDRAKRSRVPKLKLNVDDNDLFRWFMTGSSEDSKPSSSKPSHKLLEDAYEEAKKHVRNSVAAHDPKNYGDLLDRWVSFVEHRALVVLLKVPTDANAYKMFETLNDRGLRTSQADLIKNYLFGKAGDRIREVQAHWNYMRGALETLDDDNITVEFLRHALIAMRGHTRQAHVYDVVQERVKGEQATITFVSELESLAVAYVATFNPAHEKWNAYSDSTRRAIEVFGLLNVRPMRALLLAIAVRYTAKEAALAFQFLVSLGVRLLVAGSTRSGSVEVQFARAANEVYSEGVVTTKELKRLLLDITPRNEEFQSAFEVARVSKAQLARYYLRCLESAADEGSEPWYVPSADREVINLEHVLPKKPEGNWPQFTEDEVAMYVNRLGNQALMKAKENSGMKSSRFVDKKPTYGKSPYELTSTIAEQGQWSTSAIIERQKRLAALALIAWPV